MVEKNIMNRGLAIPAQMALRMPTVIKNLSILSAYLKMEKKE
jgi:hypothetical protein